VTYQAPFDALFGTGRFEYDAVVAHALPYSNPRELQARIVPFLEILDDTPSPTYERQPESPAELLLNVPAGGIANE